MISSLLAGARLRRQVVCQRVYSACTQQQQGAWRVKLLHSSCRQGHFASCKLTKHYCCSNLVVGMRLGRVKLSSTSTTTIATGAAALGRNAPSSVPRCGTKKLHMVVLFTCALQ
jgi:hypothetical protein